MTRVSKSAGTGGRRGGKFVSKAQQAWAWATHQPFARRKSVKNPRYKSLPRRKGARKR